MHLNRSNRRIAAALLAAALLFGLGTPAVAAKDGDDKAQHQAERALDQARKARDRARRNPAIAEAKGAVVTVNATARTFELQVKEANQAQLRNVKVTVKLAPEAYVLLNDRLATLADIKVGDSAKVTGVADGTALTGYLVRFGRVAPAPLNLKGLVAGVTATPTAGFTLTVNAAPVTLTLGTPSIVTLNGQPATLADVKVGDKGEATAVSGVAYVARFTRALPPTPGPARLEGTLTSLAPLTLLVKGVSTPFQLATPAIVTRDAATATVADLKVNDRCVATGISGTTTFTAYQLACQHP